MHPLVDVGLYLSDPESYPWEGVQCNDMVDLPFRVAGKDKRNAEIRQYAMRVDDIRGDFSQSFCEVPKEQRVKFEALFNVMCFQALVFRAVDKGQVPKNEKRFLTEGLQMRGERKKMCFDAALDS